MAQALTSTARMSKFRSDHFDSGSGLGHPPIISIVTAVFNGAKTLRATIESIVPQLCDDIEYIIIDGGSSDGTVDIIKEYESWLFFWTSEPDRGIYDAWNKGIDASRGCFIAFVGADDVLEAHAANAYLEHVRRRPSIEYWSSRLACGENARRIIGQPWNWAGFRRYMVVGHVGSLHRRDLYARYGKYDISYKVAGDYEFLLRIGEALQAGFVDAVTVRVGVEGVSNRRAPLALRETLSAKLSHHACSKLVAIMDYCVARLKLSIRRLLRWQSAT